MVFFDVCCISLVDIKALDLIPWGFDDIRPDYAK